MPFDKNWKPPVDKTAINQVSQYYLTNTFADEVQRQREESRKRMSNYDKAKVFVRNTMPEPLNRGRDWVDESIVRPFLRSVNTPIAAVDATARTNLDFLALWRSKSDKEKEEIKKRIVKRYKGKIPENYGIGKTGTNLESLTDLSDIKKFTGNMIRSGTDIASLVPVGATVNATLKGAPILSKAVLGNALISSVSNIANEGGRQVADEDKVDAKQLAISGGAGFGLPVLGAVFGKGISRVFGTTSAGTDLVNAKTPEAVREAAYKHNIGMTDDAVNKIAKTKSPTEIIKIIENDEVKLNVQLKEQAERLRQGTGVEPARTKTIIRGELAELKPPKQELLKLKQSTRRKLAKVNADVVRLKKQLDAKLTKIVKDDLKSIIGKGEKATKEFTDAVDEAEFFDTIPPQKLPNQSDAEFDSAIAKYLLKNMDTSTRDDLYQQLLQLKKTEYYGGLRARLSKKSEALRDLFDTLDETDSQLTDINIKRKSLYQEAQKQGSNIVAYTDEQLDAEATLRGERNMALGKEKQDTFTDVTGEKQFGIYRRNVRKMQDAFKTRMVRATNSKSKLGRALGKSVESVAGDITNPENYAAVLRILTRGRGAVEHQASRTMKAAAKILGEVDSKEAGLVRGWISNEKVPTKAELDKLSVKAQNAYYMIRNAFDANHELAYLAGDISEATYRKGQGKYSTGVFEAYDIEANLPPEVRKRIKNTGMKIDDSLGKTRKLSAEERAELIVQSPEIALAKQTRYIEHNRMMRRFMTHLNTLGSDYVSAKAKPNFVQLSDNEMYGPLAGKWIRKEVMDDIAGFTSDNMVIDNLMNILTSYEGLGIRQFRKKMLTVYNPAVRIINKHFNTGLAFQGGITNNPIDFERRMNKAFGAITADTGRVQAWRDAGLFTSDITRAEFKRQAKGVADGKTKNVLQLLDDKLVDSYSQWDDAGKLAAAETLVEKGYSVDQAVAEVSRVFQDYSTAGLLWDISAKLPILGKPFGRFVGDFAFRMIPNMTIDHPLRAASLVAAIYGLQEAGQKWSGESDEDRQERENRVGVGKIPVLGLSTEFQTPFGAFDMRRFIGLQSVIDPQQELRGATELLPFYSPVTKNQETYNTELSGEAIGSDVLLGPIMQQLINRDFRQKRIDDPEFNKYGEVDPLSTTKLIQNRIAALAKSYTPPPLIDLENLRRAAKEEPSVYGSQKTTAQAFARFFGVRVEQFGAERAEKTRNNRKYFEFKKLESELLNEADPIAAAEYKAYNRPRYGRDGRRLNSPNDFENPKRNMAYLSNPQLFDIERNVAYLENEMLGKPLNPIYALPQEHANAVLTSRAMILESGGDDKQAMLYNQPWFKAFDAAEDAYWEATDTYNQKVFGDKYKPGLKIKSTYPEGTPQEKALMAQFFALPEGDGVRGGNYSRRVFIEANPALARYFDKLREYKNKKKLRIAKELGIEVTLQESFNTSVGYDDLGKVTQPIDVRVGQTDALGYRP